MNKEVPSIGDSIKVDVIGEIVEGFVTGFNSKGGRAIVEYQPGDAPPEQGVDGSHWTWVENILEINTLESKFSHEAFKGESLIGDGEAWGVRDASTVVYETMFCERTARRLAQLTTRYPAEDWNAVKVRLELEGFDLSDPGLQSTAQEPTQSGQVFSSRP